MLRLIVLAVAMLFTCVPVTYGDEPASAEDAATIERKIADLQSEAASLPPGDGRNAEIAQKLLDLRQKLRKTQSATTQPSPQPTEAPTDPALRALMDRKATDPLIVIRHNNEAGKTFLSDKPDQVLVRGELRVGKMHYGEADVFLAHPESPQVPAEVDFSAITRQATGTLVLKLHSLETGDCDAHIKVGGADFRTVTVAGNVWLTVPIPFDKNDVIVVVQATGWQWEHAFITYRIERAGSKDDAVVAQSTPESKISGSLGRSRPKADQVTTEQIAYKRKLLKEILTSRIQAVNERLAKLNPREQSKEYIAEQRKNGRSQITALEAERQKAESQPDAEVAASIERDGLITPNDVAARKAQLLANIDSRIEGQRAADAQALKDYTEAYKENARNGMTGMSPADFAKQQRLNLQTLTKNAATEKAKITKLTDGEVALQIVSEWERIEMANRDAARARGGRNSNSAPGTELDRPGNAGSSSREPSDRGSVCPTCGGDGTVLVRTGGIFDKITGGESRPCPDCGGTGRRR